MIVVIPTKDRLASLVPAVQSVLSQSVPPDRVLIIDQSQTSALDSLQFLFVGRSSELCYCHVFPETGLVRAKRRAVDLSSGELVCFLEDDVILDEGFLETVARTFAEKPEALGVGGVCRNSPGKSLIYACLHRIFYRGMFRDSRPWITMRAGQKGLPPVPSSALSGGISAWRKEVLASVPFLPEEGFHMMEDLHYSRKVTRQFGPCLWIHPQATLQHFPAQMGRAPTGEFEIQRMQESVAFYRYHRRGRGDWTTLLWLVIGLSVFSVLKSVKQGSFSPVIGHGKAVWRFLKQRKG